MGVPASPTRKKGNGYELLKTISSAMVTRENAVHAAFVKRYIERIKEAKPVLLMYPSSRTNIVVECEDYMKMLDAYCSPEAFTEQRPPMVVTGSTCTLTTHSFFNFNMTK